ncbi:hypothetical protein GVN21_05310 [Caulobacter sp. SLTY]|uniref:DUF6958 family protein n=1 Tax=Caulobacter sp. SLTY TaxID=2683262 RepID=UPI0014124220|nr:hypothetical protein [Caulobacter sp. SLTY]NBB14781.1 hypothetical protein [Caulobacter sp. SLTY]
MNEKVEVENVNHPGKTERVDRAKYEAMRAAMLAALPSGGASLNAAELKAAILPALPDALFPGGSTAGWWLKCVQLDLEAGVIGREGKPLRFRRT